MKRFFDLFLSIGIAPVVIPLLVIIALVVWLTSSGPVIYWSTRVGRDEKKFEMPKFRTMHIGAPVVATHLLDRPDEWVTTVGSFLRRTSLDELPQVWSIFKGDMSFVGPRPALFNQLDLVVLRRQFGVNVLRPGLTGWAQVNGRDELAITRKVELDEEYLRKQTFMWDIQILWLTARQVVRARGISH